jgi:hypothetical protein
MRQEKVAYQKGYSKAVDDVIRFLMERQQTAGGQGVVPIDIGNMVGLLRERKQEILERQNIGEGEGEGSEECSEGVRSGSPPGGSMNGPMPPGPSPSLSHSLLHNPHNNSDFQASMASQLRISPRSEHQQRNQQHNNSPRQRLQQNQEHVRQARQQRHQGFTFGTPQPAPTQSAPEQSNPFQTNQPEASFSSSGPATSQPFPMVSASTTAATFSQAVTIPLAFGDQGSSHSTRKRQFFEFIFESPPPQPTPVPTPTVLSPAISASGPAPSLASLLSSTSTSTCTPVTSLGSDVEGGVTMDFSSYEQVWKRSRRGHMDDALPAGPSSSESSTVGFDPSVLVSSSHS